ncbi:MAG: polysaccharide biosynthesis/export family protein, partial [Polyangiaceae bacterium]|nr:polysaccharide biosynthesis/export family protein [Polyangiaceae bacterium]
EIASLGCFFRYEAYLVALDATVIALAIVPAGSTFSLRAAWRRSRSAFLAGGAAVAVGTSPLVIRAVAAQGATPMACANIHDQQVQTARFLARYFPHDLVAVNDIGAVAYYGDEPLLDLEGLANQAIAKEKSFRLEKPLDAKQLASLAAEAPVAVIYDEWFPDVPATWVRLARLRLDFNVVCASSTVAVYATSGEHVPRVLEALRAFGPSLPVGVRRSGVWVESPPDAPSNRAAEWRAETWDVLSVDVAGITTATTVTMVDDFGSIWLPKIGEVRVRGLPLIDVGPAIRSAGARRDVALAASTDVHVTRTGERRCRVLVTGNVARALDEPVDCGTPASTMLARAGVGRTGAVDPYIWRQEGGGVRRVGFAADSGAATMALQGGDVVVVE